jgi:Secretion system C-terminal sorting domain
MKRFMPLILLLILPFIGKTQSLYVGSGATVYVNRNGSTTTTPILNVTGSIQNNGTLTDAGSISASSDFTNNSTLTVNIGGTTLGTDYDQLNITGVATLTGSTLNVAFVNGYSPSAGATFTVLDAASLSGIFGTLNLPTLSSNLSWSTSYNSSAGTVILSVTSSVLPVELLTFKATVVASSSGVTSAVNLEWSTAIEQNTESYTLERSQDGRKFSPLSTSIAKGSNSNYAYLDEKPFNGINYYRLTINDLGSRVTYSKIVSAIIGTKTFKIKVYPSIVLDELNITTDGGEISAVEVVNLAGQTVLTETKKASINGLLKLNLSTLSSAIYLVRAQNTEGVVSATKIVKQ